MLLHVLKKHTHTHTHAHKQNKQYAAAESILKQVSQEVEAKQSAAFNVCRALVAEKLQKHEQAIIIYEEAIGDVAEVSVIHVCMCVCVFCVCY